MMTAVYRDVTEMVKDLRAHADEHEFGSASIPALSKREAKGRRDFAAGIRFAAMLIEDSTCGPAQNAPDESADAARAERRAAIDARRTDAGIVQSLHDIADRRYGGDASDIQDVAAAVALGFLLLAERGTSA